MDLKHLELLMAFFKEIFKLPQLKILIVVNTVRPT